MMMDLLTVFFGITIMYMAVTSRLEAYIKIIAAQGVLLCLLALCSISASNWMILSFIILETLGLKSIFLPWYLRKLVLENEIGRETEPYIPNFYSLVAVTLFVLLGFLLSFWAYKVEHAAGGEHSTRLIHFAVSIATVMTALFIIMTRKKLLTHIMGYILLENGIFLLSLSMAHEMPLVVNLGVTLDIFMCVFLIGVFVKKVRDTFEEQEIDNLSDLKD